MTTAALRAGPPKKAVALPAPAPVAEPEAVIA
jgi:hypothetical protein